MFYYVKSVYISNTFLFFYVMIELEKLGTKNRPLILLLSILRVCQSRRGCCSILPVTMTSVVCATIPTVFAGSSNYRVTTGWECVDNQHRDIRHSQPPPRHPEQYRYQGCGLSHSFPHSLQKLIHFREK